MRMNHRSYYLFALFVLLGNIWYGSWAISATRAGAHLPSLVVLGGVLLGPSLLVFRGVWQRLAAARKGQLAIQFRDQPYEYGAELTGTVHLQTHRPLDAQSLRITLTAINRVSTYGKTSSEAFWQYEHDLLTPQLLTRGTHTFDFAFALPRTTATRAPDSDSLRSRIAFVRDALDGDVAEPPLTPSGPVVQLPRRGIRHWTLTAALTVPGVDLRAEQIVRVNDGDWL